MNLERNLEQDRRTSSRRCNRSNRLSLEINSSEHVRQSVWYSQWRDSNRWRARVSIRIL